MTKASYAACDHTIRSSNTSLPAGAQHVVGPEPHCPLLPFGGDRRAADRARRAGIMVSPSSERTQTAKQRYQVRVQHFNHTPPPPCLPNPIPRPETRKLPSQACSTSSGQSHTAPYCLSGAVDDVPLTGRGVQASWPERGISASMQPRVQPHASSSLPAQPNSPPRNAKTSLPGAQHVVGPKPHCPVLPFGGDRRAADRARRAGILARAMTQHIYNQGFNHTPPPPCMPTPQSHAHASGDDVFRGKQGKGRGWALCLFAEVAPLAGP